MNQNMFILYAHNTINKESVIKILNPQNPQKSSKTLKPLSPALYISHGFALNFSIMMKAKANTCNNVLCFTTEVCQLIVEDDPSAGGIHLGSKSE
jgi:hypothetical protein